MSKSIFKEGQRYTFSDYFNLKHPTEEIVAALGYQFVVDVLDLPLFKNPDQSTVKRLNEKFYNILPKISFDSEISKRDFMIAPILLEVIFYANAKMKVEYSLDVNDVLNGSLDYLLRSQQEIVVIEAKKGDLDRGFNQLAAELIALDLYEESASPELIYGAVSIGNLWQFAILDRSTKRIVKDIHSYRIPEDTGKIVMILLGILV